MLQQINLISAIQQFKLSRIFIRCVITINEITTHEKKDLNYTYRVLSREVDTLLNIYSTKERVVHVHEVAQL